MHCDLLPSAASQLLLSTLQTFFAHRLVEVALKEKEEEEEEEAVEEKQEEEEVLHAFALMFRTVFSTATCKLLSQEGAPRPS